ncbi:phosphoenolpyruvate--protein phosphotransferase [SAR92 clade bacterium H455]|uniref:phosphoenolpyruvate--protein phosphotransferase n=1 Tax=SAR92 clade bacterium H455 TaxID=2974818 RepID=A0ABY5TUQ8_9GAMM|nr:phosphoenolpyruvate--protein phosphotransferase [SAR92 clade bacterium H455]
MTNISMLEFNRIIQGAALAESAEQQVQLIVDAISEVIATDVCSLYRQNANKDMALIASHGLAQGHPFIIPANQGLVGRVAQSRHSINLINPDELADYYYVAGSNEEQFHSFCGVPLVQRGDVIGVLVVQSRRPQALAPEQEAFLTTLATHLALLLASLPAQLCQPSRPLLNDYRNGISGAPGIAIGRARVRRAAGLANAAESTAEHIEQELDAWRALKSRVMAELKQERHIVEQTLGDNLAAVVDAYQMLLDDPGFGAHITDAIKTGKVLPWALKLAVSYFSELFKAMQDPYLRARHEDIEQLGDKLYLAWRGHGPEVMAPEDGSPIILVGDQLSVSDIVSLPIDLMVGIVCSAGAALSHISIFANALGIPAVMGVGELSLSMGQPLIVDGDNGQVIIAPSDALITEYQSSIKSQQDVARRFAVNRDLAAVTTDGAKVTLMANSGLQADLLPGLKNGAEGIGLYRSEIPFMVRQSLPSEADQVAVYREVIESYKNKPVYIRTLDIGADKPLPYLPIVEEDNPALGWRGIRFTLDNLQLLITQFRAVMVAAAGRDDVHLLLPMVGSTGELNHAIELLDESLKQLLAEGKNVCRPRLGVMVEVPSSISLLPLWRNKLDFISIGSNDLSQYLLAIDRNNPLVGRLYDPLHPAIIHEILRIVRCAQDCQLPVSLCGEMASDPIAVLLLIGMGIRQLSMSSSKLPLIKWLLRATSVSDAEAFLTQALTMDNAQDIRAAAETLITKSAIYLDG